VISSGVQNKVVGLVTTNLHCFSVVLLGIDPNTWRVGAVRQMQPHNGTHLFP